MPGVAASLLARPSTSVVTGSSASKLAATRVEAGGDTLNLMQERLFIGIMSGTSCDGVDAALVRGDRHRGGDAGGVLAPDLGRL